MHPLRRLPVLGRSTERLSCSRRPEASSRRLRHSSALHPANWNAVAGSNFSVLRPTYRDLMVLSTAMSEIAVSPCRRALSRGSALFFCWWWCHPLSLSRPS